jgi:hypothetical protein
MSSFRVAWATSQTLSQKDKKRRKKKSTKARSHSTTRVSINRNKFSGFLKIKYYLKNGKSI